MVHLARTVYEGANHTHLSELLSERESLDMGRTRLRRILVNAGLSSPRRRRPPKHRVRRQRMPREGMLIQMNGSYHRWLGEDGPQFTILFAVDDATGCVVNALFCDHEDTSSYFLLMQGLLRRRGIPLALHTDRHPVFKAQVGISARRHAHPVRTGNGGTGDTTDFRHVPASEGTGGADGRNLPGPADHGTPACRSNHP